LFYSRGHLWASIKLLDVNEVVIIMIILGELRHPNFKMKLYQDFIHELQKEFY
jgi:hypothetical protein